MRPCMARRAASSPPEAALGTYALVGTAELLAKPMLEAAPLDIVEIIGQGTMVESLPVAIIKVPGMAVKVHRLPV